MPRDRASASASRTSLAPSLIENHPSCSPETMGSRRLRSPGATSGSRPKNTRRLEDDLGVGVRVKEVRRAKVRVARFVGGGDRESGRRPISLAGRWALCGHGGRRRGVAVMGSRGAPGRDPSPELGPLTRPRRSRVMLGGAALLEAVSGAQSRSSRSDIPSLILLTEDGRADPFSVDPGVVTGRIGDIGWPPALLLVTVAGAGSGGRRAGIDDTSNEYCVGARLGT
jgi:hypothetical protein